MIVVLCCAAGNIRSGWQTLLTVLTLAARDPDEAIVQLACGVVDRLVAERFPLVQYDFADLVACLLAMTRATHLDVALSCVGHLRTCAKALANGDVNVSLQRVSVSAPSDHAAATETDAVAAVTTSMPPVLLTALQQYEAQEAAKLEQKKKSADLGTSFSGTGAGARVSPRGTVRARLQLWWPLLAGLSDCLGDPHLDQRSAAVSTLRDVLRDYGSAKEFSCAWPALFTCVLFPTMRHAAADSTVTPQLCSALPTQVGPNFGIPIQWRACDTVCSEECDFCGL